MGIAYPHNPRDLQGYYISDSRKNQVSKSNFTLKFTHLFFLCTHRQFYAVILVHFDDWCFFVVNICAMNTEIHSVTSIICRLKKLKTIYKAEYICYNIFV